MEKLLLQRAEGEAVEGRKRAQHGAFYPSPSEITAKTVENPVGGDYCSDLNSTGERTFIHRFKGKIVCEMTVSADRGILSARWSRRPKPSPRFFREYLSWQREVLQAVADESGRSIIQLVQVGPTRWTRLTATPRKQGGGHRC